MAQVTARTHFSCLVNHERSLTWRTLITLPSTITVENPCIVLTSGQRCPGLHEVCEGRLQLGGHDEGEEAEECEGEPQHLTQYSTV